MSLFLGYTVMTLILDHLHQDVTTVRGTRKSRYLQNREAILPPLANGTLHHGQCDEEEERATRDVSADGARGSAHC